ncbi:MAG: GAF domain-containing protein [Chloroflexota bacterium]
MMQSLFGYALASRSALPVTGAALVIGIFGVLGLPFINAGPLVALGVELTIAIVIGLLIAVVPSACALGLTIRSRQVQKLVDQRTHRLEAMQAMARDVVSELDESRLLQVAVVRGRELLDCADVRFFGWDSAENVLRLMASSGAPDLPELFEIKPGRGLVGAVADRLQVIRVDTYSTISGANPVVTDNIKPTGVIALPVLFRGELRGVLLAGHTATATVFSDEDEILLTAFAAHLAVAVENARHFQQEQERRAEVETIRDLASDIMKEIDLNTMLRLAARRAAEITESDEGMVLLVDSANGGLAPTAVFPQRDLEASIRLPLGTGVAGMVAAERKPMFLNDYRSSCLAASMVLERTEISAVLSVPITVHGELLGVLSTYHFRGDKVFTQRDCDRLTDFGVQIAATIGRAGALELERERHRQLDAVLGSTAEMVQTLDLPAVLRLTVRRAAELVHADSGTILLWSDETQDLRPAAWHGTGDSVRTLQFTLSGGVVGRVAASRQGMMVNGYRQHELANPVVLKNTNIEAVLAEPIIHHDRLIGVLVVNLEREGRNFELKDRSLIASFADHVATAIANAELFAMEQTRRRQLEAIREIGSEITRELNLTTLLQLICDRAATLVQSEISTLWLWDDERQELRARAWHGLDSSVLVSLKLGEGASGLAAAQRHGVLTNNYPSSPMAISGYAASHGVLTALAEPILYQDRLIGVIAAQHTRPGGAFTPNDQEMIRIFADQSAVAIENARLFQEEHAQRKQIEAITAITAELARELDLDALLGLIGRRAVALFGVYYANIYLWDADTQELYSAAYDGVHWARNLRWKLGEGVTGAIALSREGLIVNNYKDSSYVTMPSGPRLTTRTFQSWARQLSTLDAW